MSAAALGTDDGRKGPLNQAGPGSRLLATKLYAPPARANLVGRPRLIALLDEGHAAHLILLSAPAGFGKTTLLAEWLRPGNRRAGWLALDAADNDPARFLAYASAALHAMASSAGGELAALLHSPEPPATEALLSVLINELALVADDLTLVLDDYHVITSLAVHSIVTSLLEHLPPNLHLVIATRADPPLPLARLRSRGQLVEVRAGELRFTPEEAAAFFSRTMGLGLSPAQATALGERTEGWVAGLQLAALSLAGRQDVAEFIRAFAGGNRFILDFLVEEVLAREPEAVQTFLLHTAVLAPFCAELCDAVTGGTDGRQMLRWLDQRNLFVIPLDDQRRWYRYHHLFADLLQARLHQLEPARVAELQSRAAAWCEREGQLAEAIRYALAAQDIGRAGRLIAAAWGPLSNAGQIETVWGWLAALPEAVVRANAALSVACCWALWLRGQPDAMQPHLLDAETALGGQAGQGASAQEDAAAAELAVQIAILHSFVARYHAEFAAAIAQAEQARRLAAEEWPPGGNLQLRTQLHALIALALATAYDGAGDLQRSAAAYTEVIHWSRLGRNAAGLGVAYRLSGLLRLLGRLQAAEAICREALRFLQEEGMARLPAAGVLHIALAEVLLERNEVTAAEDHLAQGGELGRRSGRFDAVRNAAPALARLRLARGDVSGALAAVSEAQAALGESPSPLAWAELLSLRARVLIRQDALDEAARCLAEAQRLAAQEHGLTAEVVALAAARLHAAQGEPNEAAARLTAALADAEGRGWFGAVIELRILRSLLSAQHGDRRAAEADLCAALVLAEPQGYVHLFLDEGQPLANLLRALAAHQGRAGERGECSPQFLAALLGAFDAQGEGQPAARASLSEASPAAPSPLIEPLSARELEVLRLMAAGLTNEQIARRLIIALGTVKAHIHNIGGKLGAQNRAHAVARAQELGLF